MTGHLDRLTEILLASIPILGIFFIMDGPSYFGWSVLMEQYYGAFLGLVLCAVFLVVPPTKSAARDRVPWYDAVLAILGLAVGFYVAVGYPYILERLGIITPDRIIIATVAIILVLEAVRRLTGWVLPVIGILFILYARFTWIAPGMFSGPGTAWDQLSNFLFLDTNALFGTPMMVCAVIVLAFILFGNFLFAVGGGTFLGDFAMALCGKFRGGPAKMAVVASSLFGTISGSAVANVATTGVVTIPMMKRAGYQPHMAGAIEAVASTGGLLAPPIMGAAAFVMSEYMGVEYSKVALAALIPALLYFIGLFLQVDLEAAKAGLHGLSSEEVPPLIPTLKHSYLFVVPLGTLIFALFVLVMPPGKAALTGVVSILLISFIHKETRFAVKWILRSLVQTGRGLLELTAIVAMAGLIIGVIHTSGLGFVIPMAMSSWAGGSIYLLLVIVAVACIILGMGMPTVAVYILLATLMGPALVELGIPMMAAHLFILYFGTLSMFTPPICLAAYAAGSIAEAPPMRTGFTAMRLGFLAYPVPFLFVYSQTLILQGSPTAIVVDLITIVLAAFFIGTAFVGFLVRDLGSLKRLGFAIAGVGLLIPVDGNFASIGALANVAGLCLGLPLLTIELRSRRRTRLSGEERVDLDQNGLVKIDARN